MNHALVSGEAVNQLRVVESNDLGKSDSKDPRTMRLLAKWRKLLTILPAAEEAVNVATVGFDAGKFSFLEVLDAQRTLFQARVRYLGVLGQTYQSAAMIDRILGR